MCPGVIRLSDIFARLIDPFPLPDAQQFYIGTMQVTIALSAYACNILFLYNSLSTAKHIQLRPTCIFFLLHKSGTYRVLKHWQEASTVFNFQAAFRWFTERCTIMDVVSNDSYCLHSFLWKKQHKTSVSIGASCGLCKWFKWPEIFLQFLPPRSQKISFTVRSKGCPTMQYCRCVGKLIKSVVQIHKQTCWKKRWQNGRGSLNSLNMLHILLKGNTRGKKKNKHLQCYCLFDTSLSNSRQHSSIVPAPLGHSAFKYNKLP